MDEQAEEIKADLRDYYNSPERYTFQDFEDIFQDRDPFEFIQDGPSGRAPRYHFVIKLIKKTLENVSGWV